jgi:hypothetical protein
MKDNILQVLQNHDQDPKGVDMSGRMKINADKAANELSALMCYREVRAYHSCFNNYCEEDEWTAIDEDIIGDLIEYYPENIIRKAIKQFKNEQ